MCSLKSSDLKNMIFYQIFKRPKQGWSQASFVHHLVVWSSTAWKMVTDSNAIREKCRLNNLDGELWGLPLHYQKSKPGHSLKPPTPIKRSILKRAALPFNEEGILISAMLKKKKWLLRKQWTAHSALQSKSWLNLLLMRQRSLRITLHLKLFFS